VLGCRCVAKMTNIEGKRYGENGEAYIAYFISKVFGNLLRLIHQEKLQNATRMAISGGCKDRTIRNKRNFNGYSIVCGSNN